MQVIYYNIETGKISKATQNGKYILHERWLTYCYMFLFQIKKDKYILSQEKPDIINDECNQIVAFEECKEAIDEFYSLTDDIKKSFCEMINKQEKDEDIDF